MKKNILISICLMVAWNLHAQRTTNELPYGLQAGFNAKAQDYVVLKTPDLARIQKEDVENDQKPGPLRYAYPIPVNFTPENSGEWQELEDGSKVWRLKVSVPGALATVTYYDQFWLPEGAKFFLYSEETQQSIGAIISDFIEGRREKPAGFATALIYGENVIYEYYQPASVKEYPVLSINCINYGYRYVYNPYSITTRGFGDAGDCQVNINCLEGTSWQNEKHAVARVSVPTDTIGGAGWCSCALVNNTTNDYTPYVLTANHCLFLNDAMDNYTASLFVFYWEYEHPGCPNSPTQPTLRSSSGATVMANNSVSDFALLKINSGNDPRFVAGVIPYYLGWDRSGLAGTGGVGIHHPRGDVKKISTHNITPPNNSDCMDFNYVNSNFWKINWTQISSNGFSITEIGSSGSPLLNPNHRVIGQLFGSGHYCPDPNCTNPSADIANYGKFSVSWTGNGASDNRRRLKEWLDPINANPSTLNGIAYNVGPASISITGSATLPCWGSKTYSVTSMPVGFTWGSSSNITLTAGSSNNQVLATSNQTGPGYICVKNNSNVEVGRINVYAYKSTMTYPLTPMPGFPNQYTVYPACFTPTKYAWSVSTSCSSCSYSIVPNGSSAMITLNGMGTFNVSVYMETGLPNDFDYLTVTVNARGGGSSSSPFTVYPNPVNGVLYIDIDQQAIQAIQANSPLGSKFAACEIRLYNMLGVQVLQTTSNNSKEQLNVSHLPDGMYFIHLYDGVNSTPEVKTVVIKH